MEDYTEGRAADTNVESIYSDPQKALDHIEEIARKKLTNVVCNTVNEDYMKTGDSILIATRSSDTHRTEWIIDVHSLSDFS